MENVPGPELSLSGFAIENLFKLIGLKKLVDRCLDPTWFIFGLLKFSQDVGRVNGPLCGLLDCGKKKNGKGLRYHPLLCFFPPVPLIPPVPPFCYVILSKLDKHVII